MEKTEPCVELLLDSEGVSIRAEIRLMPGEMNLSAEEGSRWFGEIIRDAQALLFHRAIAGDTRPGRLVKSGGRSWSRPEPAPPLLTPDEREALAWVASDSPVNEPEAPEAVPTEPEELPLEPATAEMTNEQIGEALAAPPPPDLIEEPAPALRAAGPRTVRATAAPEQTKQGKLLLGILKKAGERLDIPTLKERSKLSDYMTRKTLEALTQAGRIEEVVEPSGGRWGGKTTYKA